MRRFLLRLVLGCFCIQRRIVLLSADGDLGIFYQKIKCLLHQCRIVAEYFDVPVVFAKKTKTKNIAGEVYTTKVESFTHGTVYDIIVSKEFLGKGDKVLVIDDFLAKGKALDGLTTLIQDSGAELVGAGIVIEKGFQDGGKRIRDKGIRVESLAIVDSMNAETGEIVFRNEDK